LGARVRWGLAAVVWTAVAAYGSLVPLRYTPLPWDEALRDFERIRWLSIGLGGRQDWVANGLVFLPIGLLGTAALSWNRPPIAAWVAFPLVTAFGTAVAVGLEFLQIFFPPRTVSLNDIVSESLGVFAGCFLWATAGSRAARWWGRVRAARGQAFAEELLAAYALILLAFSVLPCDVVLSHDELDQKIRMGRVAWAFAPGTPIRRAVFGKLALAALHAPVGYFLGRLAARHGLIRVLACGVFYAAFGELIQLVIYSRTATALDACAAFLGLGAGAVWARWTVPEMYKELPSAGSLGWRVVLGAYCVAVSFLYLWPFRWETDPAAIAGNWEGFFSRVPFAGHYVGTEFAALTNILARLIAFTGFGVVAEFACSAARDLRARGLRVQGVLLAAVVWGFALEVSQIWLVGRVADLTDVVLGVVGAALGMTAVRWFGDRMG